MVEHLPINCEVLSSNFREKKKRKKERRKEGRKEGNKEKER
jgi:hypothetical protein